MSSTPMLPQPDYMPKPMRDGMRRLSEKVARAAAERYLGQDLIMHVYLAGLAHGALLVSEEPPATPAPQQGKESP